MGVTFPNHSESCPRHAWHPLPAFFTSQSDLLLYSYEKKSWEWFDSTVLVFYANTLHARVCWYFVCYQVQHSYIKVSESMIVQYVSSDLSYIFEILWIESAKNKHIKIKMTDKMRKTIYKLFYPIFYWYFKFLRD